MLECCLQINLAAKITWINHWPAAVQSFDASAVRRVKDSSCNSLRSKRFHACSSRKLGQKQKKSEWRGRGRGKKEMPAHKPHDFEKLHSLTNAASGWRGACSVDYFALETSIKQGMLCLRASQIWSHLICGRTYYRWFGLIFIWIVFMQRFMGLESSKYKWRSSSGD